MVDVKAVSVTIDGDDNFILLKSELDDNFTDENLFHFSDSWGFGNACKLCTLVVNDEIIEITTPVDKYLEVDVAKIGDHHVLLVCIDYEKSLHYVFGFSSEKDAWTARRLVDRCFELAHADESEDSADEIAEHYSEDRIQDAYDDARHVYEAAIEHGCSEQDAREKASRVLETQLKQ